MAAALRRSFLVFLVLGMAASTYALEQGVNRVAIILPLIVVTVLFNLAVESLIPFRADTPRRPYGRDFVFTLFNIFVTAKFGDLLLVLGFTWLMQNYFSALTFFSSDALGPLWLQVVVAVLLNEFIRYWLHFFQHKIPALWKLHSIHHGVKEIYSLNTFYSHPLDYFFRNSFAWPLILLIGFSADAILIATAFVTIGGVFSHSRADFKYGWMNYFFATNELHRWHHSTRSEESDRNFGVSLIVFDLLFGTHYLPKDRPAPNATGLQPGHPYVPTTFVEVMGYGVVGGESAKAPVELAPGA